MKFHKMNINNKPIKRHKFYSSYLLSNNFWYNGFSK